MTNIHRQKHIDRSKDIAQDREMTTHKKLGRPQKIPRVPRGDE